MTSHTYMTTSQQQTQPSQFPEGLGLTRMCWEVGTLGFDSPSSVTLSTVHDCLASKLLSTEAPQPRSLEGQMPRLCANLRQALTLLLQPTQCMLAGGAISNKSRRQVKVSNAHTQCICNSSAHVWCAVTDLKSECACLQENLDGKRHAGGLGVMGGIQCMDSMLSKQTHQCFVPSAGGDVTDKGPRQAGCEIHGELQQLPRVCNTSEYLRPCCLIQT